MQEAKKILIIGSTVTDVILHVDALPTSQDSINILSQSMTIGGCAYNVSRMLALFQIPYTLFSPVGTGPYGAFIRKELTKNQVPIVLPVTEENGCCYCFVESGGERTFVSYHGAEYSFKKEWFQKLNPDEYQAIYVCGLELEEDTEGGILSFLTQVNLPIYFAPGPRLNCLSSNCLNRIMNLHPILHVNEKEACFLTKQNIESVPISSVAEQLYQLNQNTVIITRGERGCYYKNKQAQGSVPSVIANPIDTIGAGDAHLGTVIALLTHKEPLNEVLQIANQIAAKVTEIPGAVLSEEQFQELQLRI